MKTRARKPPGTADLPPEQESGVLSGILEVLAMYGVDADRQNTGGLTDGRGRYVPFGRKGNSDVTGMLPPHFGPHAAGRKLDVEAKRPGFRPGKLRGKGREHFERQLARLVRTNENGGYGLWLDDAARLPHVLDRIKQGWRIVFVGDFPFLDDGRPE